MKVQRAKNPSAQGNARHTECFINNQLTIGFVDSGADETLVRQSTAKQLELPVTKKQRPITGYGNVQSGTTVGTADIDLKIGSYSTKHKVWIVPDELQEEDIIIGFDIIGKPDI